MAADTYTSIWNKVLLRCPMAGPHLARDWVSHAFRRLAEGRDWSWLIGWSQLEFFDVYQTGTVTTTNASTTVTGALTVFTSAMVGRQIRIGGNTYPIYTIASRVGDTEITLDSAWRGPALSATTYEIYNAFCTVPTDFDHFITVWDPMYNWQLHQNISQNEINAWDAQRSNSGQAYLVSFRDWYGGYPRYEAWPHKKSAYSLPYLYVKRATDLEDSGATLPRYIRGDVLLELALAEAAKWPGPSDDKKNPYFSDRLAKMHENKAMFLVNELERKDNEVFQQNVQYQQYTTLPWAPLPMDSAFWQKHAL